MALSPLKGIFCLFIFLTLSACMSGGSAPIDNAWNNIGTTQTQHKVQPGETIYTIAWRYDLDYKAIAQWNHLSPPYTLSIGQVIRLTPPPTDQVGSSTTHQAPVSQDSQTAAPIASVPIFKAESSLPPVAANNPAPVIGTGTGNWPWPLKGKVIENFGQNGNKGVDIAVPVDTPVKAVQSGTVVYAGSNLHGYGQLVIIRQPNDMMTAYAHNNKLLVKLDQKVSQGQTIAMSGDTEASRPMLHFEIRKANKSLDPLQYLQPLS